MSELYHRDLGFPAVVETLFGKRLTFRFTHHARRACLTDRYGVITPPATLVIEKGQIIEADTDRTAIYKILLRVPHTAEFDLCMAILPNVGGESLVKTCWLNRVTDRHFTLDKSKYKTYTVPR